MAVGEVLAQIGHGGGWEQGSWTMGLRLWWSWGLFSQSWRCVMVAGGGEGLSMSSFGSCGGCKSGID